LFCSKISWAFDNLHNFEKQQQVQAAFTQAVAAMSDALQAGQKPAMSEAIAGVVGPKRPLLRCCEPGVCAATGDG
jgi:hypothetical protein